MFELLGMDRLKRQKNFSPQCGRPPQATATKTQCNRNGGAGIEAKEPDIGNHLSRPGSENHQAFDYKLAGENAIWENYDESTSLFFGVQQRPMR